MNHKKDLAKSRYKLYMLRLWQVDQDEQASWRGAVVEPRSGQQIGFTDMETLIQFLYDQILVAEDELVSPEPALCVIDA